MSIPCAYGNCFNFYRFGCALSFFKLPTNENRRKVWKKHCGKLDLSESSRICEKHFYEKCFNAKRGKKRLIPHALPQPYSKQICSCSEFHLDESCQDILNGLETVKKQKISDLHSNSIDLGDNGILEIYEGNLDDRESQEESPSIPKTTLSKRQLASPSPSHNQNMLQTRKQREDTLASLIASKNPSVQLTNAPGISSEKHNFKLVFVNGLQQDMAICCACEKLQYITDGLENHQCAKSNSTLDSSSNNPINRQLSDNRKQEFIRNHFTFACAEMFPFEGFNDAGFKKITRHLLQEGAKLGKLNVDDLLCDRNALERERQRLVHMVKEFLKKIVAEEKLVFSVDMWNNPNHSKTCITLSCHYIDADFNLQKNVLGTKIYDEIEFDGGKINEYVTDILGEYTSDPSILSNATIVTSKTPSFEESFQNYGRTNCMCSLLNEAVNHILALPFFETEHICEQIVRRLKKHLPNQNYSFVITNYDFHEWHTVCDLFHAYQELITKTQCGKNFIANYEIIYSFVMEFKKASRLLSSNETTINTVYLVKQRLIDVMRQCNAGTLRFTKSKDELTASLQNNFEITDIHWITLFLDPRYKSLKFLSKSEREHLYGTVRGIIGETYKTRCFDDHVFAVDVKGDAEVEDYLQLTGISPETNVLEFWKQREDLPKLRNLAKEMLCIPATSAAWECHFNEDKYKLSRRRLQLDLSEVDTTLILNGHSRYGLFDNEFKQLFGS